MKQDFRLKHCEDNISKLDQKLSNHLELHVKDISTTVEHRTTIKHKLGIIWAVGIFIATQIGLVVFALIKGLFNG